MFLADTRTNTTSAAGIWAIVIVAVVCLAFWLIMVVAIAPRPDVRQRHRRQPMAVPRVGEREVSVAGGAHAGSGRSVAPSRDEPATTVPATPPPATEAGARPGGTGQAEDAEQAEDTEQTRDDLEPVPGDRPQDQSGQRGGEPRQPGGRPPMDLGGRMPAQREPAADEPESSQRRER